MSFANKLQPNFTHFPDLPLPLSLSHSLFQGIPGNELNSEHFFPNFFVSVRVSLFTRHALNGPIAAGMLAINNRRSSYLNCHRQNRQRWVRLE